MQAQGQHQEDVTGVTEIAKIDTQSWSSWRKIDGLDSLRCRCTG